MGVIELIKDHPPKKLSNNQTDKERKKRKKERKRKGGGWGWGEREILINFLIERMTVLGRGLLFQPVLVTQTCTYNSYSIIALQNIDITDFPSKKNLKRTYQPPCPLPPQKTPQTKQTQTHNNNKRSYDTSECFDMSLKLSKLHVKNDKGQNQMTNIIESFSY